jgi:hypothetical protein
MIMPSMTLRRLVLVLVALAGVLVMAAPAGAGPTGDDGDREINIETDNGNRIVLNGAIQVRRGEEAENVFIVNGDAVIAGHVTNNVIALNGDIVVSGRVDENVIAVNGRARVLPTAEIGGDVRSSDQPIVAGGAQVDGDIEETDFFNVFDVVGAIIYILWWIALTISLGVLGLLFLWLAPRAAESAVVVARTRVGPAIGMGLAMFFGLAIVGFILLFTIVGTPLGFLALFTLAILGALGYVTSAFFLGRLILRNGNRFLCFLLGWGILRVVELFPALGHLVSFAAIVYGIGALTVAGWRAAHGSSEPTERAQPATPTAAPTTTAPSGT